MLVSEFEFPPIYRADLAGSRTLSFINNYTICEKYGVRRGGEADKNLFTTPVEQIRIADLTNQKLFIFIAAGDVPRGVRKTYTRTLP